MIGERRPRVLVVDDEHSVTVLLSRVLERAGYEVTCAADGEEALALLARQPVDLMFVDRCLPRLDGFAVIERARSAHRESLPVVMISADASTEAPAHITVQGYLSKPFKNLSAIARAAHDAVGPVR